jgi:hypothetical protein
MINDYKVAARVASTIESCTPILGSNLYHKHSGIYKVKCIQLC